MIKYIKNPKTGRRIKVGGPAWKKLHPKKRGRKPGSFKINIDNVKSKKCAKVNKTNLKKWIRELKVAVRKTVDPEQKQLGERYIEDSRNFLKSCK
jgi:hypothetical protein